MNDRKLALFIHNHLYFPNKEPETLEGMPQGHNTS